LSDCLGARHVRKIAAMKIARLFVLPWSLSLLLMGGCAAKAPPPVHYDAPLGGEFSAALGKPMRMDGISIEFAKVVEDSRCPKNVTCVWQGAATVALTVLVTTDPRELTLSTTPDTAASADVEGYHIELLEVAPYPDATVRRASMDYSVKLRVTRP
jgi:hypothetical protein